MDTFNEDQDGKFLVELYFLALEVLRVHILHAWDKASMDKDLKTPMDESLKTKVFEASRPPIIISFVSARKRFYILMSNQR